MLQGKKTYLIGMGMICLAIAGAVADVIPKAQATELALGGLGLMSLRAGITNEAQKQAQ